MANTDKNEKEKIPSPKEKTSSSPSPILAKQIKDSFDIIGKYQDNAKELAEAFTKQLAEVMDISALTQEVLTGVGNIDDLDLDMVTYLNVWSAIDDFKLENPENLTDDEMSEFIEENEMETNYELYTDGTFDIDKTNRTVKVQNETFTILVNYNRNTFQILKSPKTIKRGLCSLCYPNQADLSAEGVYECYDLPSQYKLEREK